MYLDASNTLFEFKYRMTALNSEWKKEIDLRNYNSVCNNFSYYIYQKI